MILIKKHLLMQLWIANEEGVPVSKLIRKHRLSMTPPTVAKLLNFMQISDDSRIDPALAETVRQSIFPEWLASEAGNECKQPSDWSYTGKMPFGKWVYSPLVEAKND